MKKLVKVFTEEETQQLKNQLSSKAVIFLSVCMNCFFRCIKVGEAIFIVVVVVVVVVVTVA